MNTYVYQQSTSYIFYLFFFLTITLFLPLLRGDLEAQVALLREEEANTEAERNKQRRVVNQS
jgi:hypothetical protein